MSNESTPVTVQIMDNEYRIVCPAAEREELLAAAEYLNHTMLDIRSTGKLLGMERIAVMAALNISYELLKCKKETATLGELTNARVRELLHKMEATLSKSPQMEV